MKQGRPDRSLSAACRPRTGGCTGTRSSGVGQARLVLLVAERGLARSQHHRVPVEPQRWHAGVVAETSSEGCAAGSLQRAAGRLRCGSEHARQALGRLRDQPQLVPEAVLRARASPAACVRGASAPHAPVQPAGCKAGGQACEGRPSPSCSCTNQAARGCAREAA